MFWSLRSSGELGYHGSPDLCSWDWNEHYQVGKMGCYGSPNRYDGGGGAAAMSKATGKGLRRLGGDAPDSTGRALRHNSWSEHVGKKAKSSWW